MLRLQTHVLAVVALATAGMLPAGSATSASITYFLSQSNDPEAWLPDGTQDYLSVTIADGVGGDIDFSVDLLGPLTSIADANFGINGFTFNSANTLTAGNIINEPVDWSVAVDFPAGPPAPINGDGFGSFNVGLSAGTRQDPTLSFTISGILGDTIADYALLSTGGSEGDTFFAVHVAGFQDQDPLDPLDPIDIGNPGDGECWDADGQGNFSPGCNILTSAWFGGNSTTPVPEPGTGALLAIGLVGLTYVRRRSA